MRQRFKCILQWMITFAIIILMTNGVTVLASETLTASTADEFSTAITKAEKGGTIQLLDDITLSDDVLQNGSFGIRQNIILDLNNHELKIGVNGTKNLYVYQGITIKNGFIKGRFYSYNNDVVMENCNIELDYDYNAAVTVSGASFAATNCSFKSTGTGSGCYAVVFTSGTNKNLSLENCTLEANKAGALNYCGSDNTAQIDNCKLVSSTTSSSSGAIRIYSANGKNNLTVTNTSISNLGEGRAVYVQQNKNAEITFGEGNKNAGKIELKGAANAYQFNVTGGQFKNEEELPFLYDDASLLNLTGGEFSVDVGLLTAPGYTCEKTDYNSEFPYEVVPEGTSVQPFYTQSSEGKVYYDTFEQAVAAVKGTKGIIYLKANVEITNPSDLDGLILKGRAGITITYVGTAADFVTKTQNISISDVTLKFADVTLNSITIVEGSLTQGKGLSADTYKTCEVLLSADSLIDSSTYEIKTADNFGAKIGALGYSSLEMALNEAAKNDTVIPVNDEIVLLEDVEYYAQPIIYIDESSIYDYATFTIDFNGYSITTSHYGACVIINHSNVDITMKNGIVTSNENIAIATNGSKENMTLELNNMKVNSGIGAAFYMAGDGKTTIKD